jgi:hypothetical protein
MRCFKLSVERGVRRNEFSSHRCSTVSATRKGKIYDPTSKHLDLLGRLRGSENYPGVMSGSSGTRREWSRMDQHYGSRNVVSDMNGQAKANQNRPASHSASCTQRVMSSARHGRTDVDGG